MSGIIICVFSNSNSVKFSCKFRLYSILHLKVQQDQISPNNTKLVSGEPVIISPDLCDVIAHGSMVLFFFFSFFFFHSYHWWKTKTLLLRCFRAIAIYQGVLVNLCYNRHILHVFLYMYVFAGSFIF